MIQAVFLDFLRIGSLEQNSARTPWSVTTDESVKSHHPEWFIGILELSRIGVYGNSIRVFWQPALLPSLQFYANK
jgi:hypothetical protein